MQDAQIQTSPVKSELVSKPPAASPTKLKDSTSGALANSNVEKQAPNPKAQRTEEAPSKRRRASKDEPAPKKPTPKTPGGVKQKVTAPAKKKKSTPKKALASDEFVVERILESRVSTAAGAKPTREYLIRWEGYDSAHDTWEPESNMSAGLLKTYSAQMKAKKSGTPTAKTNAPTSAAKKSPAAAAAKSPTTKTPANKAAAAKKSTSPKPAAKGAKKLGVAKAGIIKATKRKGSGSPKAKAAPKAAAAKAPEAKSPATKKKAAAKPAKAAKKPESASDVFVVESILGHRSRTDEASQAVLGTEYLIRWAGYDSSNDSWEPAKNLSRGMIKTYMASIAQPEEAATE